MASVAAAYRPLNVRDALTYLDQVKVSTIPSIQVVLRTAPPRVADIPRSSSMSVPKSIIGFSM
jgi:hypothetical protein